MDNIIDGRSAVIQVTFLMEDRGFCKDVFATVEKPTRYYNRIFENYTGEVATWYSASPSIFESDCRISPQTIFEVVYQGRLCARDGNGDFEGKIPFVPFFEFERREAIRCSKKLPNLKGYEQMKEKLLSLPGGEQYSLHGACQDNWIYALTFGKETVQVIDTSEWMGRSYELIAVLYTHKPTGFQFTNYCIRPAMIFCSMTGRNIRQAQILIEVVVMSKITEKIAKLLALAESPYEEEAKAALLQARRLMAEHKLMPEDIEPQENKKVVQECVGVTCTKLSSPWTVYLSTLIAAHYCCRPYRSHAHGSKVSEIGFIGMEDDFKLCKLAFLYAYDCISSRCRQIRTQKEYSAKTLREMCNSYGWGFCRGLSAAFQKQEAEHHEWELVMVVPQAVEDAVSKMKRSSYKISSTSSMNHQYAAMGYADGQEFDMRRRLEPSA